MSRTLAVATATAQVSVALAGPDGAIGAVFLRAGRRHGETLAPAIESLTALAGVGLGDLGRIAVDIGPGLFTGLRVGVATAKALGSALAIPVVACSSLDLLAHPLRHARRPIASVVDARRGEVFWALYEPVQGVMVAVTEPAVATPEDATEALSKVPDVLLAGDGARRWFAGGELEVAPAEFDHPSAAVLAELAPTRPAVPAEMVTPTYLRGADVRIGWEQR
jgi:tRNA threonylcarbamoyladenosine biosynthesis protein TsaB